jgi:hypothetical protein
VREAGFLICRCGGYLAALFVAVVLFAAPAAAQGAPFPGAVNIDGGWVPCSHPIAVARGLGCTAPTPAPVPVPAQSPTGEAPVCDPQPNPYAEPHRAAACSAWDATHQTRPPLPTFGVREVYRDHYDVFRVVVLGVTSSLEGVPVVVVQRVAPVAGAVFSFRTDEIEAQKWERVQ